VSEGLREKKKKAKDVKFVLIKDFKSQPIKHLNLAKKALQQLC
jgi:hypothetical protein